MKSRRQFFKTGGFAAIASAFPISSSVAAKVDQADRGTGPLKITKIEPMVISMGKLSIPLSEAVTMPPIGTTTNRAGIGNRLNHSFPSRPKESSFTTLVKITTDQGIVGWGEAHAPLAPAAHAKVITDLFTPILLGQDARGGTSV